MAMGAISSVTLSTLKFGGKYVVIEDNKDSSMVRIISPYFQDLKQAQNYCLLLAENNKGFSSQNSLVLSQNFLRVEKIDGTWRHVLYNENYRLVNHGKFDQKEEANQKCQEMSKLLNCPILC